MVKNFKSSQPVFNRSEVAKILNISTLTIANREKNKKYPEPKRDLNNYRIYTINDSVLYDKGYKDSKFLAEIIDDALSSRVNSNVKR